MIYQSKIYFSGDVVLLGFNNDEYHFVVINCFIFHNGNSFLLYKILQRQYHDSYYNSYKVCQTDAMMLGCRWAMWLPSSWIAQARIFEGRGGFCKLGQTFLVLFKAKDNFFQKQTSSSS